MKFCPLLRLAALGLGVLGASTAASDPMLDVRESIAIAAAPDVVWKAVKDFDNFGWHPAVASTRLTAGRNNEAQAVRTLILKDGARITEQLRKHDDAQMVQRYVILDSPLPVIDYAASIEVRTDEGGGSTVTWQSHFRRKADPDTNDDTVRRMIGEILSSGLANLKKMLERT
ncbi:MAG TPA: SRPBCC family protein [Noviherbaspirillum sp.]|uniref:SRPBCC family protein n=1 Tax=Noviherbaspirillum sp. TaxID=1926288 RepID=UPI002D5D02BB|nr:SRPBCC family protein [Noviherbaspirillum sp.]HYD94663.1 SRPBCC family protein [Noviherbaspirillum sp.]